VCEGIARLGGMVMSFPLPASAHEYTRYWLTESLTIYTIYCTVSKLRFKKAPILWPRSGVNCKRRLGGLWLMFV
jgi:hypothetical protein